MKKVLKNYRFLILIFISITIGSIIGIIMGDDAIILKPIGDIFLNLMFTIVVPLVFFTITSSIANMADLKRLGKIMGRMFLIFLITCTIAAIFMLVVVKIFNPVGNASITLDNTQTVETISIGDRIVEAITVNDFSSLLSRSHMLPLIIFSILLGIGISTLGSEGKKVASVLNTISKALMKVVKCIMYYAPIGLCAYFATLTGQFGAALIGSYAKSFILYLIICIVYYFVFFTLYSYLSGGKEGIKLFYKNILNPTATALATQSSLATLPASLTATKDIGIPKDIREVTIPIGTTMNMHGSVMASILKIAFLFTIFDKSFTGLGTYGIAILIAVMSGVVMSGIPGGGLIGEMLIVSLYNFPAGAFAIIATIGIIVDAPATAINVVGNPASTMLITRITEGKNWIDKKAD